MYQTKTGHGCSCAPKLARYAVTVQHGEAGSVFYVVDTSQPEREQPCVVRSWNTARDPNARYLAEDFAARHNAAATTQDFFELD